MLINPYKIRPQTIQGTRILEDSMGLAGFQYINPAKPQRVWTLQYLFAHIPRRALGGIRAKFLDNKNFVSFCNQRDLEVLLGIGLPGDYCYWANQTYPIVNSREWYGLCLDHEDLLDDLHDRELRLREQYPGVLPTNLEITRRIYDGVTDKEELLILLRDCDTYGMGPDPRLETINYRWVSIERMPVQWDFME